MTDSSTGAALPVLDVIDELRAALGDVGAAVLVAPPGTGKTTAVPPALLGEDWVGDGRIVVLEPRRLAARAAARRMATVEGEQVGERFGYAVRGDRRSSARTRVEVVTEGLFLRRLQQDPSLEGVSAVLLDEFHERSIDSDLALALLVDVRASLRPDLRLVVMSATIDPGPVASVLGTSLPGTPNPVPVIEAVAPLFPVETRYRPGSAHDALEDRVATVVGESLRHDTGDVLVFLPGRPEIHRTARALARLGTGATVIEELHGSLSPEEQERVTTADPSGARRVILSTTIAETSITVPGVRVVVDSGRRRSVRVDAHTGAPALVTGQVSRAGADQRRGRAARLGPGVAYRLWSESDERHRPPADLPEVIDGDLAPMMLQLRSWGVRGPAELRWLDTPDARSVERAEELLAALGAVDADGRQTDRGRSMADIGFHPRFAAVALAGLELSEPDLAAEVVAVLETSRSGGVDLVERVRELRGGTASGDAVHAASQWRRTLGAASGGGGRGSGGGRSTPDRPLDESIGRLLVAGYPDRVAQRRPGHRTDDRGRDAAVFLMRSGGEVAFTGAALDDRHGLAASRWIVVADLDLGATARAGRPYLAAALDEATVLELLAGQIDEVDLIEWDDQRGQVVAEHRRQLGGITIDSRRLERPDPASVSAALVEAIRLRGLDLLGRLGSAETLRTRVEWLRATRPDDGWPDFSESGLLDSIDEWAAPFLARARRRSDLLRIDVKAALLAQLDWEQRRSLDTLAPTEWHTASGRRVSLRYGEVDGEPATVLSSVRLRDVIGTDSHPSVGVDRQPVTLELLSPAGRPLQRTQDLPGFWRGSYSAVRSEMRGRYPKHPWPERPWEPLRRS